jgi:hypothetical protein
MNGSMLLAIVLSVTQPSAPPPRQAPTFESELEYQKQAFKQWWGNDLVTKLADLPTEGATPGFRTPYSGHDYPDRGGGTLGAMRKYDAAFNRGTPATDWERRDVGGHRRGRGRDVDTPARGLFGRLIAAGGRSRTPGWYGHCNGWTAAAIRHAEPQYSVNRNGVVFTPADIKGLLAEIYMYTDTEFLGGETSIINPAIFHLTLTNWLGRGSHPIGMEFAPGEVVVNYPIFTYASRVKKVSEKEMDVYTSIRFAMNTHFETQKSPRMNQVTWFHYALNLNDDGEIVGGRYYGDGARIDMLWAPLKPIQGGQKGNERGNPHIDVKEVLAIWRASVPEELRKKWPNIDPPEEDRLPEPSEEAPKAAAEGTDPLPLAESK